MKWLPLVIALAACGGPQQASPRQQGELANDATTSDPTCTDDAIAAIRQLERFADAICACGDSECLVKTSRRWSPDLDATEKKLGLEGPDDIPECIREQVVITRTRFQDCVREISNRRDPDCPDDPPEKSGPCGVILDDFP